MHENVLFQQKRRQGKPHRVIQNGKWRICDLSLVGSRSVMTDAQHHCLAKQLVGKCCQGLYQEDRSTQICTGNGIHSVLADETAFWRWISDAMHWELVKQWYAADVVLSDPNNNHDYEVTKSEPCRRNLKSPRYILCCNRKDDFYCSHLCSPKATPSYFGIVQSWSIDSIHDETISRNMNDRPVSIAACIIPAELSHTSLSTLRMRIFHWFHNLS